MADQSADRPRRRKFGRGHERGAVAVEFALILPILVMLLLGIATTGLSYTRAIGVTNAVREGARLGATTDASSTSGATWAADTINRVRGTQFDDPTSETAVCVQLWKKGTGQLAGGCSQGAVTPALALPPSETASPAVPTDLASGACVVRVIAARNFSINVVVVPVWNRVNASTSVARYERMDKVTTCG